MHSAVSVLFYWIVALKSKASLKITDCKIITTHGYIAQELPKDLYNGRHFLICRILVSASRTLWFDIHKNECKLNLFFLFFFFFFLLFYAVPQYFCKKYSNWKNAYKCIEISQPVLQAGQTKSFLELDIPTFYLFILNLYCPPRLSSQAQLLPGCRLFSLHTLASFSPPSDTKWIKSFTNWIDFLSRKPLKIN